MLGIERNPSIGTAIDHKSLTVRLDNDIRTLLGVDEIPFGAQAADSKVRISPIVVPLGQEEHEINELHNAGCIAGLNFN